MGFSKFGSKCDDRTLLLGELLGGILMTADVTSISKCCLSEHYGQTIYIIAITCSMVQVSCLVTN